MSQEPKKRHSRQRQGKRRASISLQRPNVTTCPNCGANNTPHTVCTNCGYYKGQNVLAMKSSAQQATQNENAK